MVSVKIFDGVSEHFLKVVGCFNKPARQFRWKWRFSSWVDKKRYWHAFKVTVRLLLQTLIRCCLEWFPFYSMWKICSGDAKHSSVSGLHYFFFCVWSSDLELALQVFGVNHPCCFFGFAAGHFLFCSLARTSCSCCFLGLWPKMFG